MKTCLVEAIILGLSVGVLGLLLSPFRFAINLGTYKGRFINIKITTPAT
jgi:hypothetical protein